MHLLGLALMSSVLASFGRHTSVSLSEAPLKHLFAEGDETFSRRGFPDGQQRPKFGNVAGVRIRRAAAFLLATYPRVDSRVSGRRHIHCTGQEAVESDDAESFSGRWSTMAAKEVSVDALPPGKVAGLKQLYGSVAPSRFLQGRHGITHFCLEQLPNRSSQKAKLAVLSHGLGADMNLYNGPIWESLLNAGFRVLRYDFLDHGWSHAHERFIRYNKTVFLQSLNELLNHVLKPQEAIDLWVGHSTGGVVGVLAATSAVHPIRQLVLISPAFRTKKPLIARLSDKIPTLMHTLVKKFSYLQVLSQKEYLKNNEVAFGKDGDLYLFPKKQVEMKQKIKRMFKLSPQVVEGIVGISLFFLRKDLLADWRKKLQEIVTMAESTAPRICLIWGRYDAVVPLEVSSEILSMGTTDRIKLMVLEAGHESPTEVPNEIATEILRFAQ